MKTDKSNRKASQQQSNMVFLGGIPLDTRKEELKELLEKFDKVISLEIGRDKKTKLSKGFAKAVLRTELGVERLLQAPGLILRGLEIGIKRWTNKADYLKGKDEVSKRKLYVKYHPCWTKEDLLTHFSLFGQVETLELKNDPFTNQPRYFAYITFTSEADAARASSRGNVADKSQFIYCELTTPLYLMPSEGKSSVCASPLFKAPTKSTKPKTRQSLDMREDFLGTIPQSLVYDWEYKTGNGRNEFSTSMQKFQSAGMFSSNHQKFARSLADLVPKTKNTPCICQDLESGWRQTTKMHNIKPTKKGYQSMKIESNHFLTNLAFYGPYKERPLARIEHF